MKKYNPDPKAKKVKYIASVIYLLVLAFFVVGSYINQQPEASKNSNAIEDEEIIWSTIN